MKANEHNVINSFKLVKNDVISLQKTVSELQQTNKELMEKIHSLEKKGIKPVVVTQKTVKTVPQKSAAKKVYVAAKEGKKFHEKNCPYAKNILPKSKLTFKTKDSALNKGYKPCTCIK